MADDDWLTLRQAARRAKRSFNTIRRWKRHGMPTRLRDGRNEVHLEVLLLWLRTKTMANPIHRARFATRDTPNTQSAPDRVGPPFD